MFNSIWEDVRREFSRGNMITRLIIVNSAIFIFVNIVRLIFLVTYGGNDFTEPYRGFIRFLAFSADPLYVLTHPWTVITSMFLHEGFWHILWNMLFLYWFGRIVGDFIGDHRILPLYLLGGLAGGLSYFIYAQFAGLGADHYAYGASGAVMAIVVAAGAISPDYIMRLLFIGDVKLKYIVLVLVLLDLFALGNNYNTGGHFAHLGGALFGYFFVQQLNSGNDLSAPVSRLIRRIQVFFENLRSGDGERRRGPRVVYRNTNARKQTARKSSRSSTKTSTPPASSEDQNHQVKLDAILDKIKQHGYESLTAEEKEFLFNASKK